MQDYPEAVETARPDKAHSREGDLASDKLGVPLLSDEPAPLSDALHIPTLIGEAPKAQNDDNKTPADTRGKLIGMLDDYTQAQLREPNPAQRRSGEFDTFGRRRPAAGGPVAGDVETNRATTPAAGPREDAATFVGVPSNHPQTRHSEKLVKLDRVALAVGGIMVIGPLFAAMLGRMAL